MILSCGVCCRASLFDRQQVSVALFTEKLGFSPLKAFIFFFFLGRGGIISVLNIATVVIEVLVAPIMDCLTATSRKMSRVSDWSSHLGDHWCDHWHTLNAVLPSDNSVCFFFFFPRAPPDVVPAGCRHSVQFKAQLCSLQSAFCWPVDGSKAENGLLSIWGKSISVPVNTRDLCCIRNSLISSFALPGRSCIQNCSCPSCKCRASTGQTGILRSRFSLIHRHVMNVKWLSTWYCKREGNPIGIASALLRLPLDYDLVYF